MLLEMFSWRNPQALWVASTVSHFQGIQGTVSRRDRSCCGCTPKYFLRSRGEPHDFLGKNNVKDGNRNGNIMTTEKNR
jgi:hypothetical protein